MEKECHYILDDLNFYLDKQNKMHALVENNKHSRIKDLITEQIYDRVAAIRSSDLFRQYGIDRNNVKFIFMDKYGCDAICGTMFLKELAEMRENAYDNSIYRRLILLKQSMVEHEDDSNGFTDYLARANFSKHQPITQNEIKDACELLETKYTKQRKKIANNSATDLDQQNIIDSREF